MNLSGAAKAMFFLSLVFKSIHSRKIEVSISVCQVLNEKDVEGNSHARLLALTFCCTLCSSKCPSLL